jgi:hypothetical protein
MKVFKPAPINRKNNDKAKEGTCHPHSHHSVISNFPAMVRNGGRNSLAARPNVATPTHEIIASHSASERKGLKKCRQSTIMGNEKSKNAQYKGIV